MADVYPVDYETPVGRLRKYIPDVRQLDGEFIFSDAELSSYLTDQTGSASAEPSLAHIIRAAAWAMIAIANDENLILKKIVTEDLQTDGPAVAKALLASAQELFRRADDQDYLNGSTETFLSVDYAPQPPRYQPLHGQGIRLPRLGL